MDKQLLQALDNLSYGLEMLVEALKNQKPAKSSTAQAIKGGDFGKSLEQINAGLRAIKKDTQEILKNQQTIIALQKKKSRDKSTEEFDGDDKKKQSSIKKGITMILLIAVAVLAIGLAFKIVGKIDFLSVVGLSIAILIMAAAFEKIAQLKLTVKEAAVASLAIVMMAVAVTVSSWILSLVKPISFLQALTGILIMGMFAIAAGGISKMIKELSEIGLMKIIKGVIFLPIIMAAVALGITLSSWILSRVVPIGFGQALTAILISIVFVAISFGLRKILNAMEKATPANAVKLVLVLPAVAIAITASSWILSKVIPIGFRQAITAILISVMFTVMSIGIGKIVQAIGKMDWKDVPKIPVFFTLMALGLAASAFIFAKSQRYFDAINWVTMLRILLLGVVVGIIAIVVAVAVKLMKGMSWQTVLQVPAFFSLLSLAIAVSAFIFFKSRKYLDEISWARSLKILMLGVVMGIIMAVVSVSAKVLNKVSWGTVLKVPVFFTLMALAVSASAFIFAKSKKAFDDLTISMIFKIGVFGVALSIVAAAMSLVLTIIKKAGIGVTDALKGGLIIVIIATTIMLSSLILNLGNYKKYPPLKWTLGVAASIAAFGIGALLLGAAVFGPQALVFAAGLVAILITSLTIVATSHILNKGKYDKHPTLKWTLGVSAALASFSLGAILLGINVINPFFYAGLNMLGKVAKSIVSVSKILAKGQYNIPGMVKWAAATTLLFTVFTPIILILGAVGVAAAAMGAIFGDKANPFKQGTKMLKDIAQSIVDVSFILAKGKYSGGPNAKWAGGVAIALGAFAPVYAMLVANSVMKLFGGGGVGPKDFAEAIKTISKGIVTAAGYFAKNTASFKNGPPEAWAKGVGKAIGAFAPVYKILASEKGLFGTGVSIEKFKRAIITITKGIIESAKIFAKNTAPFKDGMYPSTKWSKGVGSAIGAFAPIFKQISENSGLMTSGDEVVNTMVNGIVKVAKAIVRVANIMKGVNKWDSYPTKKWSWNIKKGIISFIGIANEVDLELVSYDAIITASNKIVYVAKLFSMNKKHFQTRIDPNFTSNLRKNIVDFNKLVKELSKSQDKSLMGKITGMADALTGNDPITQIAKRMITLAKGYDKLATSLIKLSVAMRMLNLKSLAQLGNFGSIQSKGPEEGQSISQVKSQQSAIVGKSQEGKSIGGGGKEKEGPNIPPDLVKKNQIYYVSQQLEKMNKILANIDNNASSIFAFMEEQANSSESTGLKTEKD